MTTWRIWYSATNPACTGVYNANPNTFDTHKAYADGMAALVEAHKLLAKGYYVRLWWDPDSIDSDIYLSPEDVDKTSTNHPAHERNEP